MVLPYLKDFLYFLGLVLWWMIWVIIIYYIIKSFQVLNNWYQSTLLGQRREDLFSLFVEIFLGKKKRAAYFRFIYQVLWAEFGKKIGYLNSSRKNTQFQKPNQPKQSSRSKVMSILNSIVFQVFFRKKPWFFAVIYF